MDNQNFNFDNIPTPRKPVFPPLDNANDNRINQVNMTENTNGNPAPNPEQSVIPYIPKSAFSQNYYNPEQNPATETVKMDRRRAAYYKYHTGQEWGKPSNYHLCMDTSTLGPKAAQVLADVVRAVQQERERT